MGDVVGLFRELRDLIVAELPAAQVFFGDRHLGQHYKVGSPQFVLCWGAGGSFNGPRDFDTNPPSLYEKRPQWEAHLYIAESETVVDDEDRDLMRLQDVSDLQDTMARAIHAAGHGSKFGSGPEILNYTTSRETEILRHGEECIVFFDIGFPVTRGPAHVTAPGIAPAINGGVGGGLVVDPPGA